MRTKIAFILATTLLLTGCERFVSTQVVPVSSDSGCFEPEPTGLDVDPYSEPLRVSSSGSMQGRQALFMKVVSRVNSPTVYTSADKSETLKREIFPFSSFYVFGQKEIGNETMYFVSNRLEKEGRFGWVSSDEFIPWSNRVGVRPVYAKDSANRICFFQSFEEAEKAARGESVDPTMVYDVPESKPLAKTPWLALEKQEFDGDRVAYKVMTLASADSSDSSRVETDRAYSQTEKEQLVDDVKNLDVFFAIDGTGSMQQAIEAVKQGVKALATDIQTFNQAKGVDVKFGLAIYRDAVDGKSHELEFNDLGSLDEFVQKLANTVADGGGDNPERGYPALQQALRGTSWREHSGRALIVVGDAPFHTSGANNPELLDNSDVAQMANDRHVAVYVMDVDKEADDDSLSAQLSSITTATEGFTSSFDDVDQMREQLVEHIAHNLTTVSKVVDQFTEYADGKRKIEDLDKDVVKILRRQGIALERFQSRLDAGELVVVSGWIVPDRSATLEVCVYDFELDMVKSRMRGLLSGQQSSATLLDLYNETIGVRIGNGKDERANENEFETAGLPFSSTSILRYTPEQLRNLPDSKQTELRTEANNKIKNLEEIFSVKARWTEVSGSKGSVLRFGWVPEKYFP